MEKLQRDIHREPTEPASRYPKLKLFYGLTFIIVAIILVLMSQKMLISLCPSSPISRLFIKFGTNVGTSFYHVKNYRKNYTLCDPIEIEIQLRTSDKNNKTYGGDFIWIWIYDKEQKASAGADEIVDNLDGTYTATITPRWTGIITIGVTLVHSSEIVSHLRHFRETYPARYSYKGRFGPTRNKVVTQSCHVTKQMFVPVKQRYRNMVYCNFTDQKNGFPWFCVKPQGVGCDDYILHSSGGPAVEFHKTFVSQDFVKNYVRPLNILPVNQSHGTLTVKNTLGSTTTMSSCLDKERPLCSSGVPSQLSRPQGFYYNDTWTSLVCKNRHFTTSDVINCFKNHTIRFIGDSTLRQWYEYLVRFMLRDSAIETKGPHAKFGPHEAVDKINNISVYFNFHGLPIALRDLDVTQIHYVSEQLDSLEPVNNTIVCLCLWAHFTGTNLQYYKDRLQSVKEAIVRLMQRSSNVRILIKSANTREYSSDFDRSNWYSWEVHKVMQQMFSDFPGVTLIDVWDMTIGHRTGYSLHPSIEVITQEMDMFFSYLCPMQLK